MNSTPLFVCRSQEKKMKYPQLKGPSRTAKPQKTHFRAAIAINRKAIGLTSSVGAISRNTSVKGHPLLKF